MLQQSEFSNRGDSTQPKGQPFPNTVQLSKKHINKSVKNTVLFFCNVALTPSTAANAPVYENNEDPYQLASHKKPAVKDLHCFILIVQINVYS